MDWEATERPFAIVTEDQEWHQSAQLGWIGCTSGVNDDWDEEAAQLIAERARRDDLTVYSIDIHM